MKLSLLKNPERLLLSGAYCFTNCIIIHKEEHAVQERLTGKVKWFNTTKGFGFIQHDSVNGDIFVHYTMIRGEGFRTLQEGQDVEFTLAEGSNGNQANDVIVVT